MSKGYDPKSPEMSHVRTTQVNNSAGFSRAKIGGDTTYGPAPGAPLYNSRTVDDGKVTQTRYPNGSPYNAHDQNENNVVLVDRPDGTTSKDQPYTESPVPQSAERPETTIMSKAGEVAHELSRTPQNAFPGDGVMHR